MTSTHDAHALAMQMRSRIEAGALDEAIDLGRQSLRVLDPDSHTPVLTAFAQAYSANGQALDALRTAHAARDLAHRHGDVKLEAEAVLVTASALQAIEDHAAAIKQIEAAEQLIEAVGDETLRAQAWRRLGVSLSVVGLHEQALGYLQLACEAFARLPSEADHLGARNSLLNAVGRRCEELPPDDPARSAGNEEVLPQWLALAEEQKCRGLHRLEVMARGNYAICASQCDRFDEALTELHALLPRYREFGMRPNEAIAHNHIGHIQMKLGRHAAACAAYEAAIAMDAGGSLRELSIAWFGLAEAHEALDDPRAALNALKQARRLEAQLTDAQARRQADQRELRLEISRLNDHWGRLASEDSLTGLPNRRAVEPWFANALARAAGGEPLSVLLIDVDHFKRVNDTWGHAVGDSVLRELARLIRATCRYDDLPARLGGEEFLVALPATPLARAIEAAQRLREAIAGHDWSQIAGGLRVTVSVGVTGSEALDIDELAADRLLQMADRHLYAAKRAGRNRVASREAVALAAVG